MLPWELVRIIFRRLRNDYDIALVCREVSTYINLSELKLDMKLDKSCIMQEVCAVTTDEDVEIAAGVIQECGFNRMDGVLLFEMHCKSGVPKTLPQLHKLFQKEHVCFYPHVYWGAQSAAGGGLVETFRFIELFEDLDYPGQIFRSLYDAIEGGHLNMVEYLVREHIYVLSDHKRFKALKLAVTEGHIAIVGCLLEAFDYGQMCLLYRDIMMDLSPNEEMRSYLYQELCT